jgi:hypothetical protein
MTKRQASSDRRWWRIAKALHGDAKPSRGLLAVFTAGLLIIAPVAVWTISWNVAGLTMLRSWSRGTAEVLAVPGPNPGAPRRHYDLVLRHRRGDGSTVAARSLRGHPFRTTWSRPGHVPQPGDGIAVVIDPRDRRRITTVDSLGLPGLGIAFGLGMLAIAMLSLTLLVTGLQLRRRDGRETK